MDQATRIKRRLCTMIAIEREKRGWNQNTLAEKAQVTQPQLAKIENGTANPTLMTIARIAEALNLTLVFDKNHNAVDPIEEYFE